MSLLGSAAIVISFDIEPAAVAEHDDWHSREHLLERLSIPGFRRGTRWRSQSASPGYLVIYEVADASVLNSDAYLRRLDNPTPWTTTTMKSYRNMARGLLKVVASSGQGMGGCALFARMAAKEGREDQLRQQLSADVVPWLATRPGIVAAHLMESAATAPMTTEQRIRGKDKDMRFVLFATGYDEAAVAGSLDNGLRLELLEGMDSGDAPPGAGMYRLAATLLHEEADPAYRAR